MTSKPFSRNTANPIRAFNPNIFRRFSNSPDDVPKGDVRKEKGLTSPFGTSSVILLLAIFVSGCGPKYTYPAEKVPKAVEEICAKENQINVKTRVVGKTLGALVHVNSITDNTKQISKDTNDKMGKVMQALTRVALSTDLPLDFTVVVIRDRASNNEFIVIRAVDDTKRANAEMIGVEESINRTVFGQQKYMPVAGEHNSFVLKEVTLENFLADQIVQRIRFNLSKEAKEAKETKEESLPIQSLVLADGSYEKADDKKIFQFSIIDFKKEASNNTLSSIFTTVNRVLEGYSFDAFDEIQIKDYAAKKKLVVDRMTLLDYQKKKVTFDQILKKNLANFDAAQDAFKLFGFNLSHGPVDEESSSVIAPNEN